jgi:two-component system cell cycle sensor histidine kinase/response regulator CckA
MTALALFNLLAGALELTIPSYALRLVRRFGTQPVGGFLVITFSTLALLHLTNPARPPGPGGPAAFSLNLIYVAASGLLLLGLCHLEALCSQRQQVERDARSFRSRTEWKAREQAEDLAKANECLTREIVQLQENLSWLGESERQYRLLFAENPQPMWISDLRTSRCLAVNKAALRQYGFTEQQFIGLSAKELLLPETVGAYLRELARPCSAAESRGVWQHRKKDRTLMPVEITASDLKFGNCPARLILACDISERRRRELELCQTEKMQALGRVAVGVAHHFNNILTVIDGHANLMLRNPQTFPGLSQLQQISLAARRGVALTRQLLAAGGYQAFHPQLLDLNGLIQSRQQMLRQLIDDRIVLECSFTADLPKILGDPRMLESILDNLILNARDAMPAGGAIMIETALAHFEPPPHQSSTQTRAGDFARLTVSDSGCGMTPEVQLRMFEPFFTTHDFGQGIGLGLAGVYGAVKQQGGWVEFATKLGVGTEFRLFFPCAPVCSD